MCDFFSFISDGKGNVYYFSAEQRNSIDTKLIRGFEDEKSFDSHSIIAEYYKDKFKGNACDNCNKYELNILEDKETIDQINVKDDSIKAFKAVIETERLGLLRWKFKKGNSGDSNSGNWNSGDWNSGYSNSGNSNSGNSNSGYSNSGYSNSGYWNSGNSNSGYSNSGNSNSGYSNSGNSNSGDRNSGYWNSGNSNSGNWNSGDSNSGDRNSGNRNSGNRNSGNWNSGNSNSGYFNNTTPKKVEVFGKLIDREKWNKAQKPDFIYFDLTEWVSYSSMTVDEKREHPEAEHVTGGYLKKLDYKEAWQKAYDKATPEDIKLLKALPNFNAAIFEDITGIKVDK